MVMAYAKWRRGCKVPGAVVAGLRLRARMVTPASAVHFVHEMTSFWPSGGLIAVISCVEGRAVRKDELAAARRG